MRNTIFFLFSLVFLYTEIVFLELEISFERNCCINTRGNLKKVFILVHKIEWIHYQKIDKYKRKYRGNISVGKFPRDFTDGNIPSVYTDGITVGKKFKTKQKKKMTCHFYPRNYRRNFPSVNSLGKLWTLFIMTITKGITDGIFRRYFPESVIWRFSEKIQLI
jgi:hypothetical protein